MVKKSKKKMPKWPLIFALIIVVVVVLCFVNRQWFVTNYKRIKLERTTRTELKQFNAVLTKLGFTDLNKLETRCGNVNYDDLVDESLSDMPTEGGTQFECSSMINRYIVVPEDKLSFNAHAEELTKVLQANGWESRKDLTTVSWFKKLSEGVDYQADQYNQKKVGDIYCVIDFFTAFSKPKPPALSYNAQCTYSKVYIDDL